MARQLPQHPLLWLVPLIALLARGSAGANAAHRPPGRGLHLECPHRASNDPHGGYRAISVFDAFIHDPNQGLTIWDASSSAKTLLIMLRGVIVFLPIVLAYTSWVFHVLKGKITLEYIAQARRPVLRSGERAQMWYFSWISGTRAGAYVWRTQRDLV